MISVLCSLQQ